MKALRIGLLILIIIGLGLLVTIHFWVPNLVAAIMSRETSPVVAPVQMATSTQPTSPAHAPQPKPAATSTIPAAAASGIDLQVTIGPTCPVEHFPEQPECADKPYQTTLVLASTIIGRNGGILIRTDAQGRYSQDLAPGTYTIRAQSTGTPPTLNPVTFEVKKGERTSLHLQFDSGIR